ncbi:MAG TPA: metal-dependent hydrolase [Chitinophagales bacterium]|nr:metal-dependent hydrolase [Chitinophagales bacterium]
MSNSQLQFLGHATFRIVTPEGKIILIDPWLTGNEFIPAQYRKQEQVDLMLITHGHEDHFDPDILNIIRRTQSTVIANPMCRWYLIEQGINEKLIEPMNLGGTISVIHSEVTMVNAFHISHIPMPDGKIGYTHPSVGFVIKLSDSSTIYFAGDTCVFGDMKLIGEIYRPHIAVLPIGDRYTMGPKEAAHAAKLLNVSNIIPCHYGTYPVLTGTVALFRELSAETSKAAIHALQPGESVELKNLIS